MLGVFHYRIHGPGERSRLTPESALLTAGALILTLLIIGMLFFGVFAAPAS